MLSYLILGFVILWLIILSVVIFRIRQHYHRLISRTKKRNIDDILDNLLEKEAVSEKEINLVHQNIKQLVSDSRRHFQKIGFLRFNPFERVAGDQSFVLSLLDADDNGLVMNFIYTREGVRIYEKQIKDGKADKYDLSQEEKDVIKKAK